MDVYKVHAYSVATAAGGAKYWQTLSECNALAIDWLVFNDHLVSVYEATTKRLSWERYPVVDMEPVEAGRKV